MWGLGTVWGKKAHHKEETRAYKRQLKGTARTVVDEQRQALLQERRPRRVTVRRRREREKERFACGKKELKRSVLQKIAAHVDLCCQGRVTGWE